MSDMREKVLDKAFKDLTAKKDIIIFKAINKVIGEDWKISDMLERLSVVNTQNGCQIIKLDGKSIVEFEPPEPSISHNEHLTSFNCKQKYKFTGELNRP